MATLDLDLRLRRAALLRRLALLGVAVAAGFVLQDVLRAKLDAIVLHSQRDMLAARAELAVLFRVVGSLVFGATGALGVAIAASSRGSSGSRSSAGIWLGCGLLALSLAGAALIWYMAAILDACRA